MPDYFESGFCVREPSWHKKETLLQAYPDNWDEARMAAGLMWEPTYLDIFVPRVIPVGQPIPNGAIVVQENVDGLGATLVHCPVDGHRAIARDDTMEVLATPLDSYELITHAQMGDLLEAYTEAWRKVGAPIKFETAGAVRGGRQVWALVRLDEPFQIPGDESLTYPYATLLNAHDGSAACKVLPTSVRVVCWNTWQMASAEGERSGHQVIIRHTGDVEKHLDNAKATLASVRDEAKEWEMLATDLAGINVSDSVVQTFLDEFIPIPENASERTRNNRSERQSMFRELYNESPTNDGIRGTAYGLVQAAGEYLDHLRPYKSHDTYLARTMLRPEPIKGGVIRLVRDLVASEA